MNKFEIGDYLRHIYGVDVTKVNTHIVSGKVKRHRYSRQRTIKRPDYKLAYVTLVRACGNRCADASLGWHWKLGSSGSFTQVTCAFLGCTIRRRVKTTCTTSLTCSRRRRRVMRASSVAALGAATKLSTCASCQYHLVTEVELGPLPCVAVLSVVGGAVFLLCGFTPSRAALRLLWPLREATLFRAAHTSSGV